MAIHQQKVEIDFPPDNSSRSQVQSRDCQHYLNTNATYQVAVLFAAFHIQQRMPEAISLCCNLLMNFLPQMIRHYQLAINRIVSNCP